MGKLAAELEQRRAAVHCIKGTLGQPRSIMLGSVQLHS
jgi:hypothetical protein